MTKRPVDVPGTAISVAGPTAALPDNAPSPGAVRAGWFGGAHAVPGEIEQMVVPTEKVVEVRRGRKVDAERKFFPGYVLVRANLTDAVFSLIKNTPKVTGFLGDSKPVPITDKEAEEKKRSTNASAGPVRYPSRASASKQKNACRQRPSTARALALRACCGSVPSSRIDSSMKAQRKPLRMAQGMPTTVTARSPTIATAFSLATTRPGSCRPRSRAAVSKDAGSPASSRATAAVETQTTNQ